LLRIEFLATEPLQEFIGIRRVGEAVNVKPLPIIKDSVPPAAYRQILAELVNLLIPTAALTEPRRQDDLMGPVSVNGRWRQLALPTHFQTAA